MRLTPSSSLEVLEARIAPASVLLQNLDTADPSAKYPTKGYSLVVKNSIAPSLAGTGATFAVLVNAKDSLFAGLTQVAKVTDGRALFLFADVNGDAKISIDELTGVRVSSGFEGTIYEGVKNSIVADLSRSGVVASVSGKLTIDALTVNGAVGGAIFASGAINNVTINTPADASLSTIEIRSGSAANGFGYSLVGGWGLVFQGYSASARGSVSIDDIFLSRGTAGIFAGEGGSISDVTIPFTPYELTIKTENSTTPGVVPGSISRIEVQQAFRSITIKAGDGADGVSESGGGTKSGTRGGSIMDIALGLSTTSEPFVTFTAGNGGSGFLGSAKGGAGGSLQEITITSDSFTAVTLKAGDGGSSDRSTGGDGGVVGGAGSDGLTITKVKSLDVTAGAGGLGTKAGDAGFIQNLKVTGTTMESIALQAGNGGDVAENSNKGGTEGGSVGEVSIDVQTLGSLDITAGAGGAGGAKLDADDEVSKAGAGGAGGAIKGLKLANTGGATDVTLTAGAGGAAGDEAFASGGAGGAIAPESTLKDKGFAGGFTGVGNFTATGGAGGSGKTAGAGGSIAPFTINQASGGDIALTAGDSGSGYSKQGDGGDIGSIKINGAAVDSVTMTAGSSGGSNGETQTNGSAGGSITGFQFVGTSLGALTLRAGDGGSATRRVNGNGEEFGISHGGAGGALTGVTLQTTDDAVATALSLTAGNGGDGVAALLPGVGGSISELSLDNIGGGLLKAGNGGSGAAGGSIFKVSKLVSAGDLTVAAGDGGAAQEDQGGAGGAGGFVGDATSVFTTNGGTVTFNGGDGGSGGDDSANHAGGAGGAVTAFTVVSGDSSGRLAFVAGQAGAGSGTGSGGIGGAVSKLMIQAPLGLLDLDLLGGDGGAGGEGNTALAGVGGAVSTIAITGDVSIALIAEIVAGSGGDGDGTPKAGIISAVTLNGAALP